MCTSEMMPCQGCSVWWRQHVRAQLVFERQEWEKAQLVFQSLRCMTQLVLRPLKGMDQIVLEALREIESWCLHCLPGGMQTQVENGYGLITSTSCFQVTHLFQFLLPCSHWWPLISFLFLWIYLSWIFHKNRITEYVAFYYSFFHIV